MRYKSGKLKEAQSVKCANKEGFCSDDHICVKYR